jgi:hypothetical protein
MGLLSILLVRHDCLHEVREDKNLGVAIYNKLNGMSLDDREYISSGVEVVASDIHSSDVRLIIVEGNTAHAPRYGVKIPDWSDAEHVLVRAVEDLNYIVTKKRKKK